MAEMGVGNLDWLEAQAKEPIRAAHLRQFLDQLQLAIAAVSQAIGTTYFPPEPDESQA